MGSLIDARYRFPKKPAKVLRVDADRVRAWDDARANHTYSKEDLERIQNAKTSYPHNVIWMQQADFGQ